MAVENNYPSPRRALILCGCKLLLEVKYVACGCGFVVGVRMRSGYAGRLTSGRDPRRGPLDRRPAGAVLLDQNLLKRGAEQSHVKDNRRRRPRHEAPGRGHSDRGRQGRGRRGRGTGVRRGRGSGRHCRD